MTGPGAFILSSCGLSKRESEMFSWELFSVVSGVAVTGADSSKIYSFLSAENRVGNSGFRATESNFRLRRAAMNSWIFCSGLQMHELPERV